MNSSDRVKVALAALPKTKLDAACEICIEEEQSYEYMVQYLMDSAGVNHACVMAYLKRIHSSCPEEAPHE